MSLCHRHLRRLMLLGAALLCLASCAGSDVAATDLRTVLTIRNDSSEPLKCVILYGHWITTDIANIAPGQATGVDIMRAVKDGALYIPRFDGRHMMIERIACGRVDTWWESNGDIPLLPLREAAVAASETRCRLATRADCSVPQAAAQ
jgi:hypothetical protein